MMVMVRFNLYFLAHSNSVFSILLIGPRSTWEGLLSPVLPTQLTAMRSLSAPAVTFLTGDWKDKKAPGEQGLSDRTVWTSARLCRATRFTNKHCLFVASLLPIPILRLEGHRGHFFLSVKLQAFHIYYLQGGYASCYHRILSSLLMWSDPVKHTKQAFIFTASMFRLK